MSIEINMSNVDEIIPICDKGTQTEIPLPTTSIDGKVPCQTDDENILNEYRSTIDKSVFFKHLTFANQTYWEHFSDSIGYFKKSFSASLYFLCHAFWPDIFEKVGSKTIHELNDTIKTKYKIRIVEIKGELRKF